MSAVDFLVDTDCVIDHFNKIQRVTARLKKLQEKGLGLSVVSLAELWEGVLYARDPQRSQLLLEDFLTTVSVLGLDSEISKRFGELRGLLRRQGKLISDFDLLIAATGQPFEVCSRTRLQRARSS